MTPSRRAEIDALWIEHGAGRRFEGFWRFIEAVEKRSDPVTSIATVPSMERDELIAAMIDAFDNVYEAHIHIGSPRLLDNKRVAMGAALNAAINVLEAVAESQARAHIAALDAQSAARARAEVEAMRERCIAKVREFDADRFKVSDTWRDDMSASEIYGTGVADAASFIEEELRALPIEGDG